MRPRVAGWFRRADNCDVPPPESSPRPRDPSRSGEHAPDREQEWLAKLDAQITGPRHEQHASDISAIAPVMLTRPHPATLGLDVLRAQCDMRKGRSSGPGGQHRNKVETLVRLSHTPTGIEAHAGERRSATENLREALWRLRLSLATRARCDVPAGDARSTLWRARCTQQGKHAGKIVVSPVHDDYPAILSEALDVLWACDLNTPTAAARLVCTSSQLTKLIKDHPPAWLWVNAQRTARGLHQLK
jgi:hypothetical protein